MELGLKNVSLLASIESNNGFNCQLAKSRSDDVAKQCNSQLTGLIKRSQPYFRSISRVKNRFQKTTSTVRLSLVKHKATAQDYKIENRV